MSILNDKFSEYLDAVLPSGATPHQEWVLQRAFYAGTAGLITIMRDMDKDGVYAEMDDIMKELVEFVGEEPPE